MFYSIQADVYMRHRKFDRNLIANFPLRMQNCGRSSQLPFMDMYNRKVCEDGISFELKILEIQIQLQFEYLYKFIII